jgi:hypothetical protein
MSTAAAALGVVAAALIVALVAVSGDESARRATPPPPPPAPRPLAPGGPGQVVGYVRDAEGRPIGRARVRVVGTGRQTATDRRGRYELREADATGTLEAAARGHAAQQVALAPAPGGRGSRIDFSLARTRAGDTTNSADRVIVWADCARVAALGAAEVERWIDRGVDGFVCSAGRLRSMGGEHEFSGDRARLSGQGYALQRQLAGSAVVRQARRGRLRLYLGIYASDATNPQTPFKEWFDDQGWAQEVLPQARELAAAARSLDFAGVALDQELYPTGGAEPSWAWDYPGHTRTEPEARERVTARGRELMQAFVSGYPGLELVGYATQLRDSWEEKVQAEINNSPDSFDSDVRLDLWNGMTSVQGYSAIWWLDAIFYKTPHLGKSWDPGLQYNAASVYSLLSRSLSNWAYASERLHLSPFAWIDKGPSSEFERARDPEYVDEQLQAFREWGAGGAFGVFAFGDFAKFDYAPYDDAIRGASTPKRVDTQPPRLTVAAGAGGRLSGTAEDNLAIRVVRWYDGQGRFGTAETSWDASGSPDHGYSGRVSWSIDRLPGRAGERVTIVAEDVKGLASTRTVTLGS